MLIHWPALARLAIARFRLQTVVKLMSASSPVSIIELIDRCPLGRLQTRIIVLCGLVALLDGFDVLAIGVAAPPMAGSHCTSSTSRRARTNRRTLPGAEGSILRRHAPILAQAGGIGWRVESSATLAGELKAKGQQT